MTRVIGVGLTAAAGRPDLSDVGAIVDRVEQAGAEFAELSVYDQDIVLAGRIIRHRLGILERATSARPLRYTVHGPLSINFFDDPARLPRHFEVLSASLEVAAELGAVHYVLHSGLKSPVPQQFVLNDCYSRQREWLARAGEIARSFGVIVCVENLFGTHDGATYASSCRRLAKEIAMVGHTHVKATLDVGHAFLHAAYWGLDFLEEIAALAPLAKHVHIHDNFGRADDIWTFADGERVAFGHGDLHLPVGWGAIPWDDVMRTSRFPAETVFNIELKPRYWYEARATVEATKAMAAKINAMVD
jgi:sugar phosphate isomerase/epimerase